MLWRVFCLGCQLACAVHSQLLHHHFLPCPLEWAPAAPPLNHHHKTAHSMFGDNEKVMFKHHPSLLSSLLLQSIGIAKLQLFYRRKQQTKLIDDVKQNQIGNKYLMQT